MANKEAQPKETNVIELESAAYFRIAQHDGKEVRLYARPIDPKDFENCQLYSVTAKRGKAKGEVEFFVTPDDYLANRPARANQASNVQSMLSEGLTPEEIIAKLLEKDQARKERAEAKKAE